MKERNSNILLTVFTPSFNRAHTLSRTYESLKKQDCKDFIWLVVDDGSTDNTKDLVGKWIEEEKSFDIRYFYKENGGMHSAHNAAYRIIDTEINICIDSDDMMAEGAVKKIIDKWVLVRDQGYAGLIALDADMNTGKIIGSGFREGTNETTLSGYYENGGKGDKKLIYRTDIIRSYPEYPEFEGEKYLALAYKYLLIDQDYNLCILDEVVCNVEYQPDGSSNSMFKQYLANPKGFAFWRTIKMKYDVSLKRKILDCVHYCSSAQIGRIDGFVKNSPYPFLTVLCIPAGHVLTAYIKMKAGVRT